jgi:dGTPase
MLTDGALRREREAAERMRLAPYASLGTASLGRRYPEAAHPVRMCFERDRDRIIHSRCFRRLEYKAQVFVNGTADHYRTRLTHTMEMAAVSRTLARVFRVQEDLTEAIVLAHDVGHTPFGHCGESALNEMMAAFGGFDHNRQSLRWVDLLEAQYPDFPGLNLSWEVRAGLMKHEAAEPGAMLDGHAIGPHPALEAQIADLADDITYYAHDTDDALEAGVLTAEMLAEQPLWQLAARQTARQYLALTDEQQRRITVRNLLDVMVQDVMQTSRQRLTALAPTSLADIMTAPDRMLALSPETEAMALAFRAFLCREFYFSAAVQDRNQEGVVMMKRLFEHYRENPATMGQKARNRVVTEGLERTVCDYLSGFTDRYAMEEYQRFGLGEHGA